MLLGGDVHERRYHPLLWYGCACAGGFYGAIWKYAGIILIAAPLFAATDFVEMRLVLVRHTQRGFRGAGSIATLTVTFKVELILLWDVPSESIETPTVLGVEALADE